MCVTIRQFLAGMILSKAINKPLFSGSPTYPNIFLPSQEFCKNFFADVDARHSFLTTQTATSCTINMITAH